MFKKNRNIKNPLIYLPILGVFSILWLANPTESTATGCTYPAQVLNLTNWKETLPIGSSGSPIEIKQPALATYSDQYFVVNSGCDGVQFRAPVSGVTTSGSNYPRSELREMANNGTTNASWATDSGVHTMFIDEAVTALPITKRHIVVGQVHDSSSDVIVIRLEYPKLFIDINGSDGPTLDANYTLGKRFTVKFVASNGQISIYYNGNANPAYTLNKIGSGNYFKAGAYTQSNCSKELSGNCVSTNYGEMIIYNVWVTHSSSPPPPPPPPLPMTNSLANNNTLIAHSNNFSAGYEASKLWDGCYEGVSYNSNTCTAGGRDISSFWLEFDLGKLYDISQARLYGDAKGEWVSKTWTLKYKKDLSDAWTALFSNKNAFVNNWLTESLNIKARYMRVEVSGDAINFSPGRTQAREFEMYGTEAVATPPNPTTPLSSSAGKGGSSAVILSQAPNTVRSNPITPPYAPEPTNQTRTVLFTKFLYQGIYNEETRQLQTFLSQDTLLYPEGFITGYFGLLTRKAVQRFQCKYGIICDGDENTTGYGRVGVATLAKLNELISQQNIPTPPIQTVQIQTFTEKLFLGSRDNDVRSLQEFLAKDASLYPEGFITGYFGLLTKKAVQRFQCKYDIICDGDENTTGYGQVGPKTLQKLNQLN